jgi:REP element-mobilizing transposase RayT
VHGITRQISAAQRRQHLAVGASPRTVDANHGQSRAAATQNWEKALVAGTYTTLYYHIVFSTKSRQPLINVEFEDRLHQYIAGIIRGVEGTSIEINGTADHVHILTILPPKIALSDALRDIKANSSKWVHETHRDLHEFAWQDGFAAFTVSRSQVEPVRQYIRDQKIHHRQSDYKQELLGLLDKHEIEYDERYIWD